MTQYSDTEHVERRQGDELLPHNIFRYKFTEEFIERLSYFAKLHQHDDRHSFKDAWKIWIDENEDIITMEMNRLNNNQYSGDIIDKMYKSARYYYRTKNPIKKQPKMRRPYIGVNESLLSQMDGHIISHIHLPDYQPKRGFLHFCEENTDLLRENIQTICAKGITEVELIQNKIKKTYKNRYFMLLSNTRKKTNKITETNICINPTIDVCIIQSV